MISLKSKYHSFSYKDPDVFPPFYGIFTLDLPSPYVILSRHPLPIPVLGEILSPLNKSTWILIVICLLIFSLLFNAARMLYLRYRPDLVNQSKANFADMIFFRTWAAILETDAIDWFTKTSAGQLLQLIWCIFVLSFFLFYNVELRSSLMRQNFESPINSLDDIDLWNQESFFGNKCFTILK